MMTQAEYARHRGVSGVAVHKAVKSGKINLVDGRIDQATADKQWAQRVQARVPSLADGGKPAKVDAPPSGDSPANYFEERARRERAMADQAEMEAAKMRGDLVPVEDVKRQWAIEASRQREAWLQLADRLAPLLEMRPLAFVRATLDAEVRQILTGLAA
jgi:hypothetical protein